VRMAVFWDVVLCSLVDTNRRFRETYCLQHHNTPCYNPKGSRLHSRGLENLKYHPVDKCANSVTTEAVAIIRSVIFMNGDSGVKVIRLQCYFTLAGCQETVWLRDCVKTEQSPTRCCRWPEIPDVMKIKKVSKGSNVTTINKTLRNPLPVTCKT
jgi:hypothetical protein